MNEERLSDWEEHLSRALQSTSGRMEDQWTLRCLREVNSTMDYARGLIPEVGDKRPALVLAEKQSAGRGRSGREWIGIQSAFLGTYLFFGENKTREVNSFSLVVGITVCQALCQLGCELKVKWPNDLVSYEGEKVGGILVDVLHGSEGQFFLIGLGINISGNVDHIKHSAKVSTLDTLMSVTLSPVQLAARLSWPLLESFRKFHREGFGQFRDDWMEKAAHLGQIFLVKTYDNEISGRFIGISQNGALLLESDQGVVEILSGHVVSII